MLINADGRLQFTADGVYSIHIDISTIGDASGDGYAQVKCDDWSLGTALPDTSYFTEGNDAVSIPVRPSLTFRDHRSFPPDRIPAGAIAKFTVDVTGAVGVADLSGVLAVRRLI